MDVCLEGLQCVLSFADFVVATHMIPAPVPRAQTRTLTQKISHYYLACESHNVRRLTSTPSTTHRSLKMSRPCWQSTKVAVISPQLQLHGTIKRLALTHQAATCPPAYLPTILPTGHEQKFLDAAREKYEGGTGTGVEAEGSASGSANRYPTASRQLAPGGYLATNNKPTAVPAPMRPFVRVRGCACACL